MMRLPCLTPNKIAMTYTLFGDNDDTVNCKAAYLEHYTNCRTFPGGHRLNKDTIVSHLLPLIEEIMETMQA